jgi:NAD+ kinase
LIANPEKPEAAPVVRAAARLIARAGRTVLADAETMDVFSPRAERAGTVAETAARADLLLVFGGDGTILRIARDLPSRPTPLLGINVGGLGFLTAVRSDKLAAALRKLWAGGYRIERRPLLEARRVAGGPRFTQHAFNDFVLSRGTPSRLIELEVAVDGEVLTRYRADGLIVSSPTGSTAYSLAAGGAIVAPEAQVFAVTPICPHTLTNRPVIVSMDSTVTIRVLSPKLETSFSADGQWQTSLNNGDVIRIRKSSRTVSLARLGGTSFFQTLRAKLHWSGSSV